VVGWARSLRRVQTGFVMNYALTMLLGALAVVAFLLARGPDEGHAALGGRLRARPRRAAHRPAAAKSRGLVKQAALVVALLTFAVSLPVYFGFDARVADYQFQERRRGCRRWGISYHLGVDGISLLLVLLTTFLMPLTPAGLLALDREALERVCRHHAAPGDGNARRVRGPGPLPVLRLLGAMLIPMYLIIGIWGGPTAVYAAVKFVLYTLAARC
jgi:hypothetical protein